MKSSLCGLNSHSSGLITRYGSSPPMKQAMESRDIVAIAGDRWEELSNSLRDNLSAIKDSICR